MKKWIWISAIPVFITGPVSLFTLVDFVRKGFVGYLFFALFLYSIVWPVFWLRCKKVSKGSVLICLAAIFLNWIVQLIGMALLVWSVLGGDPIF